MDGVREDILVNRIAALAQKQPEHLAVVFKSEQLTYRQIYEKSVGIAENLKSIGINQGDKIAFSATSKPETIAVYLAIELCGGVAVFLDKNGTPANMRQIYDVSEARILITDKPMKEYADGCKVISMRELYGKAKAFNDCKTDEMTAEQNPEALAEILFTSGTTGKPKGVMLSYRSVFHILKNTIHGIGMSVNDRVLLPLPLHHSFALRVLRAVLYQGATVVLQNGFTFAKESEKNIVTFHCNALACVPASYELLKGQMQDAFGRVLGQLKYIEFSAGSLSVKQRKEITALLPGVTIYNTWGSSETGGAIFCNISGVAGSDQLCAALGKPLSGAVCVEILDDNGNEIESDPSHPGRMALRGDMNMVGYWRDEKLTAETLQDGRLLTGDLAYIENGYVFMVGRADDIINVGGEKVSPIEVENIASEYPHIKECACIGAEDPDEVLGRIPILFVVPQLDYREEEFVKFFLGRAERYKLPLKIITIGEIPRNRMQKVDRKRLLALLSEPDMTRLRNPVVDTILSRRSIRRFTEKEIEKPILDMILKCGFYAPSGHNMQSWRFTVLTEKKKIEELKSLTRITAEKTKVYFYGFENPKVLVLISNDERNQDGCQDASCAAENMMLAAASYGIGSVWLNPLMTLRHQQPVEALLDDIGIPQNHIIWAAVALGYPISEGVALKKKADVIHYI